ncbi:four helix bundle protein [Terriglobus sp.]|uniref:four helix bundle protein n=1 Tax=Terriglobus sp. TaxID=1889013 RepID=UPI003B00D0A7
MPRAFRELDVWHVAMELATEIYKVSEAFPKHELYGLTSQIRRCAVSVPSNIAEGSQRATSRDYANFITIAKGSTAELETQLILALRLGYLNESTFQHVEGLSFRVARMLSKLSSVLRTASREEREKRITRATR